MTPIPPLTTIQHAMFNSMRLNVCTFTRDVLGPEGFANTDLSCWRGAGLVQQDEEVLHEQQPFPLYNLQLDVLITNTLLLDLLRRWQ